MKGKVKKEYQILLPKLFGEKIIGRTISDKPDKITGRKFSVYARNIDPNIRKYYYKFNFKIIKIEENKAITSLAGYEVSRSFISKSVKEFSTRIDGYVIGKTKDDIEVILKPFVVTAKNVKSSIASNIRKKIEEYLKSYISDNNLETIIKRILNDDLQRDVKKILNIIYPISVIEIRKIQIKI